MTKTAKPQKSFPGRVLSTSKADEKRFVRAARGSPAARFRQGAWLRNPHIGLANTCVMVTSLNAAGMLHNIVAGVIGAGAASLVGAQMFTMEFMRSVKPHRVNDADIRPLLKRFEASPPLEKAYLASVLHSLLANQVRPETAERINKTVTEARKLPEWNDGVNLYEMTRALADMGRSVRPKEFASYDACENFLSAYAKLPPEIESQVRPQVIDALFKDGQFRYSKYHWLEPRVIAALKLEGTLRKQNILELFDSKTLTSETINKAIELLSALPEDEFRPVATEVKEKLFDGSALKSSYHAEDKAALSRLRNLLLEGPAFTA